MAPPPPPPAKKKCDEERPRCARCAERGQECIYEPMKPRRRRQRRQLTTTAAELDMPAPPETPGQDQYCLSPPSRTILSPLAESVGDIWPVLDPNDPAEHPENPATDSLDSLPSHAANTCHPFSPLPLTIADRPVFTPLSPIAFDLGGYHPGGDAHPEDVGTTRVGIVTDPSSVAALCPANPKGYLLVTHRDHKLKPLEQKTPKNAYSPSSDLLKSHSSYHLHDLAATPPVWAASPRLEFLLPSFAEFSDRPNRRALVDHFCNVLSHLIVLNEDTGNAFQQLLLPLCRRSPAALNALYALACGHLEHRGVVNSERSLYFHSRALQELASLIQRGVKSYKKEFLATVILLIYYEVLVQKGRSNIIDGHLKGVMTVLQSEDHGVDGDEESKDHPDPTERFLERAFRFYDVIAALSLGTAPISKAPPVGRLSPLPPLNSSSSLLGNVDVLLGFATPLWPVIHRLSNLAVLKKELTAALATTQQAKVSVLRAEFEATAHGIETALKQWYPVPPAGLYPEEYEQESEQGSTATQSSEKSKVYSVFNNALAYRHSALVYLYRNIYEYPRRDSLVQEHTHMALAYCSRTVQYRGPMGALLWPLFVSACEAVNIDDRELARHCFAAIDQRQGMTNIERAWWIVQEVWRRVDVIEEREDKEQSYVESRLQGSCTLGSTRRGNDLWRRVSEDMGMVVVFG